MKTVYKAQLLQKRKWRIRKTVVGTAARPRRSIGVALATVVTRRSVPRGSVIMAEGDRVDGGTSRPLDSIDPLKLTAGLGYDAPDKRWGGQAIVTHVAGKAADEAAAGAFRPDAFTILDLTAYWRVTDQAAVRLGVFNVTDETYWCGAMCADSPPPRPCATPTGSSCCVAAGFSPRAATRT